jgi:L-threonylcarbamoyladenylate synthase
MEILRIADNLGKVVMRAAGTLRQGGVIIYPTDTLYGLGVDAFSDAAVDKLYELKGREAGKPTHCIVSDLTMAEEYAEVNDAARKIMGKFLPGALTLVLPKKPGLDGGIARGINTIGIRIPANDFCIELAKTFGKPFTATSANKAGEEPSLEFGKVIAGISADLAIDAGNAPLSKPSTVVNLVSGHPSILREGAIPVTDILALF